MIYYRSFTQCLIGLGISCLFVAFIAPGDVGPAYAVAGVVMLLLGIIGFIIKYDIKSKETDATIKVKSKYEEKYLGPNPDCPTCKFARGAGAKNCPDCGKEL